MSDGAAVPALAGKAVVITGAGRGLGRAYAVAAGRAGAAVVVNDVDAAAASEVAAIISDDGGAAVANAGSVASWDGSQEIIECCLDSFGRVDGLVNNAGVLAVGDPWTMDEAANRHIVEVNLLGSIFCGTHALKAMVAQGSGSIVNVSSSAQFGIETMATYCATKGGLASLTYAWALDARPHNVRVNAFAPVARTAMSDLSPVPVADIPAPEDNAPAVVYLLSDLSDGVTGQVVQRRGSALMVAGHPHLTDHTASCSEWTVDAVERLFGPVLREASQPVGFAIGAMNHG